jgi:hypothetical protein
VDTQRLYDQWREKWPDALRLWSSFVQLREPVLCRSTQEAKRQKLAQSFAAIRLSDHQIIIDLEQVHALGLGGHPLEILGHEIGHHIYCPADLTDNARMLARIRRALPYREQHAPFVANLFSDLLINDRLQRVSGLDMAGIYRALKTDGRASKLWQLYMGIYEYLWALPPGTLSRERLTPDLALDANLGARVVRVYQRDWLTGASRFATLVYPYLAEEAKEQKQLEKVFGPLADTAAAGESDEVPDGLASEDGDEDSAVHPSEDPAISGQGQPVEGNPTSSAEGGDSGPDRRPPRGGDKPRAITEYGEILRASGVKLDETEVACRYYRELASRHLVRFPEIVQSTSKELEIEGTDLWDAGSPIERIDWLETVLASPKVIPGVTTRERLFGAAPGRDLDKSPPDVYVGIDCSGSMSNPRRQLSYPVLAGVILACSALRSGCRVMACLSGETPGKTIATDGFIRSEADVLALLTDYLGTGYSFGVHRLQKHIVEQAKLRPTHLLLVSDSDLFTILDATAEGHLGWNVAEAAAARAGAGASVVLNLYGSYDTYLDRLRNIGWKPYCVTDMAEVVAFAAALGRELYESARKKT